MSTHNINQKYKILGYVNHIFSHFHLKLFVVDIKLSSKIKLNNYKWMTVRTYNSKTKIITHDEGKKNNVMHILKFFFNILFFLFFFLFSQRK